MSNSNLSISDLQKIVHNHISETKIGYFSELSNLTQLTEEVGELARIINRLYGQQTQKNNETISKEALADELADILFVTICLANQTETNLQKAFHKNLQKKQIRDNRTSSPQCATLLRGFLSFL